MMVVAEAWAILVFVMQRGRQERVVRCYSLVFWPGLVLRWECVVVVLRGCCRGRLLGSLVLHRIELPALWHVIWLVR